MRVETIAVEAREVDVEAGLPGEVEKSLEPGQSFADGPIRPGHERRELQVPADDVGAEGSHLAKGGFHPLPAGRRVPVLLRGLAELAG